MQNSLLRSHQPRDLVQSANNSRNLPLSKVQTLITRKQRAYIQGSLILSSIRLQSFRRAASPGLRKNLLIVPLLIITLIQLSSLSCSKAIWIKRPLNFPRTLLRSQVSARRQALGGTKPPSLLPQPRMQFLKTHKVLSLVSVFTRKSFLVNNVGAIKHRSERVWETVGFFSCLIISQKILEMLKSIWL